MPEWIHGIMDDYFYQTLTFYGPMTNKSLLRFTVPLLAAAFAVLFTGCKTIDATAAANFSAGVTAAKTQADAALSAAAQVTRDGEIGYVVTQSSLKESDFVQTPTADTIAVWDQTLSTVQKYAQDVAALVAPGATKTFNSAATNLAESFNQTATNLLHHSLGSAQADAGLSTAFTEAANMILQAKAQATARNIASQTDPKIAAVFTLLAAEIGETQTNGLRGTVHATWEAELSRLYTPFDSATNDIAKRTLIAQQFADILNKRDAQDQSLAALRSSLLALESAHHALAQGDSVTLQAAISLVIIDAQNSSALFNQFKAEFK
jgi:hypothetical protein